MRSLEDLWLDDRARELAREHVSKLFVDQKALDLSIRDLAALCFLAGARLAWIKEARKNPPPLTSET